MKLQAGLFCALPHIRRPGARRKAATPVLPREKCNSRQRKFTFCALHTQSAIRAAAARTCCMAFPCRSDFYANVVTRRQDAACRCPEQPFGVFLRGQPPELLFHRGQPRGFSFPGGRPGVGFNLRVCHPEKLASEGDQLPSETIRAGIAITHLRDHKTCPRRRFNARGSPMAQHLRASIQKGQCSNYKEFFYPSLAF